MAHRFGGSFVLTSLLTAGLLCEAQTPATNSQIQPVAAKLDLSKLSLPQRQVHLSAQRASDWLIRANRPDGRFVHGYSPALRMPLEGDDFLHQAEAAFALARAARHFRDEKAAAIATQALLTLLLETTQDSKDPSLRHTSLPPTLVNRVATAAVLTLAIHELPAPGKDLLDQAEQLCNYLRSQQRPDGSFKLVEEADAKADEPFIAQFPGLALYALARSMEHRPAAWKADAVKKACAVYHPKWRQQRTLAMTSWHTAAYAEVLSKTPDKTLADCVFEMNDWVTTLQNERKDPRHPLWIGGFRRSADASAMEAPNIGSAMAAMGLVEACRVARQTPDLARLNRYRQAADHGMQFLATLQYTDANTQHFAEWYRPVLVGGFHASHEASDLRIDFTAHALCALVQHLRHASD